MIDNQIPSPKPLRTLSLKIQKYVFSKKYGKTAAYFFAFGMSVFYVVGLEGNYSDPESHLNGFVMAFGLAMIGYAVLYGLAYDPTLTSITIATYSVAAPLDASIMKDIINAIGGIALLAVFLRWGRKVKNPNVDLHPDNFSD